MLFAMAGVMMISSCSLAKRIGEPDVVFLGGEGDGPTTKTVRLDTTYTNAPVLFKDSTGAVRRGRATLGRGGFFRPDLD